MSKPIIALVAGGYSGEYEVSLKSAQGISSWLSRDDFEVYTYIISAERWYVCLDNGLEYVIDRGTFGFHYANRDVRPDYVYITIHGTPGEDGVLQGYLDVLGIPYNTGGVLTESLSFNKFVCNRYLNTFEGIRTAPSLRLVGGECSEEILHRSQELGYPLFVKPNTGGSSVATSLVNNPEELLGAIQLASKESTEVIVETLIQGTEVTCGLYALKGEIHILEITEVVTSNSFFDFDAKYNGAVEEITPARIPEEQAERIRQLSKDIYRYIQARGIIRIDYIIEPDGYPTLLEVNTTPGMTATSFIPQQVKAIGQNMPDLLKEIIYSTLKD